MKPQLIEQIQTQAGDVSRETVSLIEEISEFVSNPTNLTDRKREISLVLGGMQRLAASVSQLAHAVDMIAWSHRGPDNPDLR